MDHWERLAQATNIILATRSRHILHHSLCVLLAFTISGCATGAYGKFYTSETTVKLARTENVTVLPFSEKTLQSLLSSGHYIIGRSAFNGGSTPDVLAANQARQVGADVVLIHKWYDRTEHGIKKVTKYQPPRTTTVTSFEDATAMAMGPGGTVLGTGFGQSTAYVTTPGYSYDTFEPYSLQRYEHRAIYLKRLSARTPP